MSKQNLATDGSTLNNVRSPWTLEVSWEVFNKVGYIFPVIRSKAYVSTQEMGDNYCLLGTIDKDGIAGLRVENAGFPANSPFSAAVNAMGNWGFKVRTGRWLVDGKPQIILFDTESAAWQIDAFKQELVDSCNLGIPHCDVEANDAIILGFMVAQFITEFRNIVGNYNDTSPRVVAHFHEWQAGVGLILLRSRKVNVATIFTIHNVTLSKELRADNLMSYQTADENYPSNEARTRGIYHRYEIEREASHMAHVFTAASDIAGYEAKRLLKRKPDIITPNGLNLNQSLSNVFNRKFHISAKMKIHKFVNSHLNAKIDLNKTLYFLIAAKYEYNNKGADIFIESLAKLNFYLKSCSSDTTVVAFLIFPTQANDFNVESGHAVSQSLKDSVKDIQQKIGERIYRIYLSGGTPEASDLLHTDDTIRLKRSIYKLHRDGSSPPETTHNVVKDWQDPVLNAVRRCQLLNTVNDRVKVIFHSDLIGSKNALLQLCYEEFVHGCDLHVFPSNYEPWAYSPAECTVMGMPNITTNITDFGSFMHRHLSDPESYGIYIVNCRFNSVEESIEQLTQFMFDFTGLDFEQRMNQRKRTVSLCGILDWKNLCVYYCQARTKALKLVYEDNAGHLDFMQLANIDNPDEANDDDLSNLELYSRKFQYLVSCNFGLSLC